MSTNAIDKTRDKMRLLSEREIEAANEKTTVMARRYGNKFFETKKYSTADKKPTVTARRYGNNFFLWKNNFGFKNKNSHSFPT